MFREKTRGRPGCIQALKLGYVAGIFLSVSLPILHPHCCIQALKLGYVAGRPQCERPANHSTGLHPSFIAWLRCRSPALLTKCQYLAKVASKLYSLATLQAVSKAVLGQAGPPVASKLYSLATLQDHRRRAKCCGHGRVASKLYSLATLQDGRGPGHLPGSGCVASKLYSLATLQAIPPPSR